MPRFTLWLAAGLLAVSAGCSGPDAAGWGLATPERLGGFERVEVMRAETPEGGMTAGYQRFVGSDPIVATMRVRPAPGARVLIPSASLGGTISADASTGALESSIAQVRRFYPKAEVVEQSAATLVKRGALQPGRSAVLTYRELNHGQERPMKLEIYSFCCAGGRWNYEYRFRYPDGVQDPAAIAAFLRESSWTAAR